MSTPRLSIVIPCYNESGNIPQILDRLRSVLAGRSDVQVVLVDNGSKDDSAQVFQAQLARPEHAFATLCKVEVNQGYGFGILAGLGVATGDYLAWTHADMQTDPNDVLLGFEKLLAHPSPDRVFLRGRRIGRNPFDTAFTFGMSLVASAALRTWLHDINAQPKMFNRSFLETWQDPPHDFSLDLFAFYQARRQGLAILEQPVHFGKRAAGEAKGGGTLRGKWKLIVRTWGYIRLLRARLAAAPAPAAAGKS